MESAVWEAYSKILRKEILPTTGCTEPISIAYCAAKAHEILGMQPTAVTVAVSGDVLKNAKDVIIPNTNGLKGIQAAVAAGIICGDATKGMQVISTVTEEQHAATENFIESVHIDVSSAETNCPLYISVTLYARTSYSRVVISDHPTNVVEIMKNGEAIMKRPAAIQNYDVSSDYSCLNFHDIVTYADHTDLSSVKDLLDLQINHNMSICDEGMNCEYGTNIGRIFLNENHSDPKAIARAYAAAGSDARMNGCNLPVAILGGSGNRGITASVPIICYAKYYKIDSERLYRALLVSDLLSIYLKAFGNQPASFCSVESAGCTAGAGIAYLLGGDENAVACTLVNAISIVSKSFCDGANPSCTVKIASAVETGILGYQIYLHQKQSNGGIGITAQDADEAIRNFCRTDN